MDWPTGQQRRAWLDRQFSALDDGLQYYLGPTGIPDRLSGLANLAAFTDAGDYVEAGEASQALWNEPSLQNAARYATAGTALALPFIGARGVNELSSNAIDWLADEDGAFAGIRALTADRDALAKAQEMTASGASRDDVWRDTGWFRGVDGNWRFEIDDSGASFSVPSDVGARAMAGETNLAGEFLTHPALRAAYPEYADIPVRMLDLQAVMGRGTVGGYAPEIGLIFDESVKPGDAGRSTALHELQHFLQGVEGFSDGGNWDLGGEAAYRKLAGEVEARNVQARLKMTPDQRRARPPWLTQDVPDDQQIIRGLDRLPR